MEVVGNYKTKGLIGNWLSERYKGVFSAKCPNCNFPVIGDNPLVICTHCNTGFEHESKSCVIIWGNSGDGKTFICEYFADYFDVELYRVTSEDITDKHQMSYFLQSLNTTTLDGRKKLILIDDFDEFSERDLRVIQDGIRRSRYPVIFTCIEYPKGEFVKDALVVHMMKPFPDEIVVYLKTLQTGLSDLALYQIAEKSASFRSAILTAQSSVHNEFLLPYVSVSEMLRRVRNRNMQDPITESNVRKIFNAIKGVDDDSFSVMKRFAEFDFLIKRYKDILVSYYREVDPFLVNNMVEKIENITLESTYKKFESSYKRPANSVKKNEKKVEKKASVSAADSLDAWF